jgi:hypothetical protein
VRRAQPPREQATLAERDRPPRARALPRDASPALLGFEA